jgi:serine/threonine protein kinase
MHRYQRVEPHTISESANVPSIDLLGQGAYGTVYRAIDLDTQEVVAMKSIKPEQQQEGISSNTLREIILLKQLQHKNVVELKNVFMDQKQQIHLVFELVDLDLKKYMDQHRDNLDKFTVQTIIKQIVDGLSYCHCHGIMHRDLKPQNILIFLKDKTIKLADFGLART